MPCCLRKFCFCPGQLWTHLQKGCAYCDWLGCWVRRCLSVSLQDVPHGMHGRVRSTSATRLGPPNKTALTHGLYVGWACRLRFPHQVVESRCPSALDASPDGPLHISTNARRLSSHVSYPALQAWPSGLRSSGTVGSHCTSCKVHVVHVCRKRLIKAVFSWYNMYIKHYKVVLFPSSFEWLCHWLRDKRDDSAVFHGIRDPPTPSLINIYTRKL